MLYHLGWGLREFGEYAESVAVLEEAIEVALSAELYNTVQWALGDLGLALLVLNDHGGAESCFARAEAASAEIGEALGDPVLTALALEGTARIAAARDQHASAEASLAQAEWVRAAHGRPAAPHEQAELGALGAASDTAPATR